MKLLVAFCTILALSFLQADDLPQEPKLINLNVIAVDNHGQAINDLTSDDFQVTDAGKPQKIAFFRHNESKLEPAPALAPNEFSNRVGVGASHATVILFDLLNESFSTRGVAANHLVHDLEGLETSDTVYLYFLTVDGHLFPVRGLPNSETETHQPTGAAWTRQIKPIMDEAMRTVLKVRPPEIDVAVRVQLTYIALDSLATRLSGLPGRKNVVWITDGVPIALGPGRSDTGDFVDFTPQMRRLSESLDRSGVSIYPVRQVLLGSPDRIGGSTGDGATGGGGTGVQSEATLDDFANMTGGRPNAGKDIGSALTQAMNDLRFSYQVGYYAPPQSRDGKFHKLRVTCKRKGVRIQAKTGYYAWPDPPGTETRDIITSAASTAFDASEIGLRGTLSSARHLDVRIDAKDVAFVREGAQYTAQLRFALVDYSPDGRTESSAISPLDLHYSVEEHDKALKEGVELAVNAPSKAQINKLRLILFDRGSNAVGSLTIPIK